MQAGFEKTSEQDGDTLGKLSSEDWQYILNELNETAKVLECAYPPITDDDLGNESDIDKIKKLLDKLEENCQASLKKYGKPLLQEIHNHLQDVQDKCFCRIQQLSRSHVPSKLFFKMFEAHAADDPGNVALVYSDTSLTYKQLNDRANQLAHRLINLKRDPNNPLQNGDVVAIFMTNTPEAVIAILAIMKAGLAYVPITKDEDLKIPRMSLYVRDSNAKMLIVQDDLMNDEFVSTLKENPASCTIRSYQELNDIALPLDQNTTINPDEKVTSEQLAYILFSSGSSKGIPKGTKVLHRGLYIPVEAAGKLFKIKRGDRVGWHSLLTFDASLLDIATALGNNATSVIVPQEIHTDKDKLTSYLFNNRVNVITFVPAILKFIEPKNLPELRGIFSAGEAPDKEVLNKFYSEGRDASQPRTVANGYGNTEFTIFTSYEEYHPGLDKIGIGQNPIDGAQWFLLPLPDEDNPNPRYARTVLEGAGELYLVGPQTAAGYVDKEAEYARRIRTVIIYDSLQKKHIFVQTHQTGDVGIRHTNGSLLLEHRVDDEIKFQGVKINVAAIENAIVAYSPEGKRKINRAKVRKENSSQLAARNNDHKQASAASSLDYLHVYLELNNENPSDKEKLVRTLFSHLRNNTFATILPSRFSFVLNWPTIENKKNTNVAALPGCKKETFFNHHPFKLAPSAQQEHDIAKQWRSILELPAAEPVYLDDNFYHLGASSIHVALLLTWIAKHYEKEITQREFAYNPTIRFLMFKINNRPGNMHKLVDYHQPDKFDDRFFPTILIPAVTGDASLDHVHLKEYWAKEMEDWPLFGIKSASIENAGYKIRSLKELAKDTVESVLENEIMKHRYANSPIYLIGYSAGGSLAYEMAALLTAKGRLVEVLCLDSQSPTYYSQLIKKVYAVEIHKLMMHMADFLRMNTVDLNNVMPLSTLQEFVKRDQLDRFWQKLIEHRSEMDPELKQDYLRYYTTLHNILNSILDYVPLPLEGVTLLTLTETIAKSGQRLGWPAHLPIEIKGPFKAEHLALIRNKSFVESELLPFIKEWSKDASLRIFFRELIRKSERTYGSLKDSNFIYPAISVDQIVDSPRDNNSIIVKLFGQGQAVKLMLVGSPGMGKTALFDDIAAQWANSPVTQRKWRLIIKMSLKDSQVLKTFSEIDKLSPQQKQQTLLLIDDCDAVGEDFEKQNTLRQLLSNGSISFILGSRSPIKLYDDLEIINLIGFTESKIKAAIERYFVKFNKKSAAETLLIAIKTIPGLGELCANPYFLSKTCEYWSHRSSENQTFQLDELIDFIVAQGWRTFAKTHKELKENDLQNLQGNLENLLTRLAQSWNVNDRNKEIPLSLVEEIICEWYQEKNKGGIGSAKLDSYVKELIQSGFVYESSISSIKNSRGLSFSHYLVKEFFTIKYLLNRITPENQNEYLRYRKLIETSKLLKEAIRENQLLKNLLELPVFKGLTSQSKAQLFESLKKRENVPDNIGQSALYLKIKQLLNKELWHQLKLEILQAQGISVKKCILNIYNFEPENKLSLQLMKNDDYFVGKSLSLITADFYLNSKINKFSRVNNNLTFLLTDHSRVMLNVQDEKITIQVKHYKEQTLHRFLSLDPLQMTKAELTITHTGTTDGENTLNEGGYVLSFGHGRLRLNFKNNPAIWYELHISDKSKDVFNVTSNDERTFQLNKQQLKLYRIVTEKLHSFAGVHVNNQNIINIEETQVTDLTDKERYVAQLGVNKNKLISFLSEQRTTPLFEKIVNQLMLTRFGAAEINDSKTWLKTIPELKVLLDELDHLHRNLGRKVNWAKLLTDIIVKILHKQVVTKDETLNVHAQMKLISKIMTGMNALKESSGLLVLGLPRAGKSTIVNYLTGVPLKHDTKKKPSTIKVTNKDEVLSDVIAKIGETKSATLFPRGYPLLTQVSATLVTGKESDKVWKQIRIIDTPGFDEELGPFNSFVTSVGMDLVTQTVADMKGVLLVIPFDYFSNQTEELKGQQVIELFDRLEALLPDLFMDEQITKSLFIMVTKSDIYNGDAQLLAKLVSDYKSRDRNILLKKALPNAFHRNEVERRVAIWSLIEKMLLTQQIYFFHVNDDKTRNRLLRAVSVSPGISKKAIANTLNTHLLQKTLIDNINTYIHTWKTLIFERYLTELPHQIETTEVELKALDHTNNEFENKNSSNRDRLNDLIKRLSVFSEKLYQDIDSLDRDILDFRRGEEDVIIEEWNPQPNDLLTEGDPRPLALERAQNIMTTLNANDFKHGTMSQCLAKDYTGNQYRFVVVDKENRFDNPNNKYKFDFVGDIQLLERNLHPSGNKLIYTFKVHFKKGDRLPQFRITHQVPKAHKYRQEISRKLSERKTKIFRACETEIKLIKAKKLLNQYNDAFELVKHAAKDTVQAKLVADKKLALVFLQKEQVKLAILIKHQRPMVESLYELIKIILDDNLSIDINHTTHDSLTSFKNYYEENINKILRLTEKDLVDDHLERLNKSLLSTVHQYPQLVSSRYFCKSEKTSYQTDKLSVVLKSDASSDKTESETLISKVQFS